ncbi:RloB domain-containing protein [Serratia marcescens]|uniref:RloB domain-containing protein n=1 Tax=Serratia marcescens TaxID=615 RepID=UPI0023A9D6FF|nr:RloB domain-containing protein [Serratia marcescens]WEA51110.1 RloB domain-containing protein [Serratia marcescens]BEO46573.1 hypothetical protein SMQE20_11320 [Serratia marcescens]
MAPRKQVRKTKPTLLLVGEGFCEKAFLAHLKGMYSLGHIRISICTAKGKGPDHVIKHALSCKQCDGYDRVAVLLDTDLPWPKETVKKATSKGLLLVGSDPCLEGLLLDILQLAKEATNNGCKNKLHPLLSGSPTDRDSYVERFTKQVLDEAAERMPGLKNLLEICTKA